MSGALLRVAWRARVALIEIDSGGPPLSWLDNRASSCATEMGSIRRVDRPKPWRARYRAPNGRGVSQSFRRKVEAEKWLLLEEGDALAGRWHDPASGTELFSDYCRNWLEGRAPTVAEKTHYNTEAAVRGRLFPPSATSG